MDQQYAWRAPAPGETLSVHIESTEDGAPGLRRDARAARARRSPGGRSRGVTARRPLPTLRMLALIYAHAAALRLRGVPVHPHPARTEAP